MPLRMLQIYRTNLFWLRYPIAVAMLMVTGSPGIISLKVIVHMFSQDGSCLVPYLSGAIAYVTLKTRKIEPQLFVAIA